jgi:hypothetical protein
MVNLLITKYLTPALGVVILALGLSTAFYKVKYEIALSDKKAIAANMQVSDTLLQVQKANVTELKLAITRQNIEILAMADLLEVHKQDVAKFELASAESTTKSKKLASEIRMLRLDPKKDACTEASNLFDVYK